MRVAIVSPNPANNSGGVERFCHTLSAALSTRGASPEVVGIAELSDLPHDVVITNGMVGRPVAAPRIHVYHGCWVEHVRLGYRSADVSLPWRTRFLVTGAVKEIRAGRKAYRVAVSDATAAEVSRWYRYDIQKVITNAVDTATFAPADRRVVRAALGIHPEERLALFVGRPEARKRPDIAAAAAQRAGYRLLLAGPGKIAGATSLGVLAPEELTKWIQAVDCVIAPSEYEGCSIAILEALSAGTAVVASRVGWIPTLIEHVPAYRDLTAPAGDLDGFTRALRALSASAQATIDATCYVRAEQNLEKFARKWEAAIDAVLRRTRRL